MNPDKLFDYLEGRLPAPERAALEDQLISDEQLQRELAVARRIHAGMGNGSREALLDAQADVTRRGRKMALRVGAAFIILMALNVGAGLWIIARHESKNPNRALLEAQTREQIRKSLEHAATAALTPLPSLGVSQITISAAPSRLDAVADEVVALAGRLGGSAAKGLPDEHRIGVLVDLPLMNHGRYIRSRKRSVRRSIDFQSVGPAGFQPAESTRQDACVPVPQCHRTNSSRLGKIFTARESREFTRKKSVDLNPFVFIRVIRGPHLSASPICGIRVISGSDSNRLRRSHAGQFAVGSHMR